MYLKRVSCIFKGASFGFHGRVSFPTMDGGEEPLGAYN